MKKSLYLHILLVFLLVTGCSIIKRPQIQNIPALVPAEDAVPGVPERVQFADYWIRTAPDPDKVIMTPENIEIFNNENPQNDTYLLDVLSLPLEIDGAAIRKSLAENARWLLEAGLFVTGDIPLEKAERHRINACMDTSVVPDMITPKFGVILRREMGKNWPTTILLMSDPGDNEFDAGVVSTIDMGEPVALLHTSRDGLWSYVQTYGFTCWIHSDAVAFGDIETVKELTDRTNPVVAIAHRISVYGTPHGDAAMGAIQMGSYLPVSAAGSDFFEVLVPARGNNHELVAKRGYIHRSSDVSFGFLPYTLRNVYRQCFSLYSRRYGWGGMFEERDCSAFVQDIFRCFGFRLPRNSSKQALSSNNAFQLEPYDRETRLEMLKSTPGGITLLGIPGHIMIYLGHILETPYVIHAPWAWRTPGENGSDITHRVARVTVTGLMLGEGSKRGAFIDRLSTITILGNYSFTDPKQ
jgi:hypothetical protein